jgi:hypothetical protein
MPRGPKGEKRHADSALKKPVLACFFALGLLVAAAPLLRGQHRDFPLK